MSEPLNDSDAARAGRARALAELAEMGERGDFDVLLRNADIPSATSLESR